MGYCSHSYIGIADAAELGSAISSGEGLGLAIANVAIDAVGVASPIPGISEAAHAIEGAAKFAKVAEGAGDAVKTTRELRGGKFASSKASAIEKAGGKCEYCGKNAATQGDHAKTLNTYKNEVNEGKMTSAEAKAEANGPGNVVGSCKQCNQVDKHTSDLGTGPGQYTPPNPSPRVKDMLEP